MRFSQSTHLLMSLSLGTLTSIIRTTWIPHCDSHSLALLALLLCSDANMCSTMAFPPLGNSDRVLVSVSNHFPIN